MSGALNPPTNSRFHASPATANTFATPECGSSAAAAASFLELANPSSAANFPYDFGLPTFRNPAAHHATTNFGVSYFAASTAADAVDSYPSLAWDGQPFAPTYSNQSSFTGVSCDFSPFSLAGSACHVANGRLQGMTVQRFGGTVRNGGACSGNGNNMNGGGGTMGGSKSKPRRRVATMAQRRAANIRERRRMFNLNSAFDKLRKKVPTFAYEKRLSRIETLRLAIMYIAFMTDVVRGKEAENATISHPPRLTLPPQAYNSVGGHIWSTPHGHSPAGEGHLQRSERLNHLCSRQI